MSDEALDSGLFAISLSESEDETQSGSGGVAAAAAAAPRDRTGQTEQEFQAVKEAYRAKVENGEIWQTVQVPLAQRKISKQEGQEILHAVEELYFYKRYNEAVAFIGKVFEGGEDAAQGLDAEVKSVLKTYEARCIQRIDQGQS